MSEITERKRVSIPQMTYDEALPVAARRKEIAEAIRGNQVVILSGETGSGKSTQLPKICLELGYGVKKLIGHTQPRRIAATSISARLAQELRQGRQKPAPEGVALIPPEKLVGYKIRFTDATSPETCVKLMTDGVLLAETRTDRLLNRYEVLIIDEAHERSLNIDFLLGILRRLVDKRKDLKVVIMSATIDARRFAAHFTTDKRQVPIVEIAGRTFPVEVRYQPVEDTDEDTDEDVPDGSKEAGARSSSARQPARARKSSVSDGDVQQAVVDAIGDLSKQPGDMLVFLPTERDIHEVLKLLHGEEQRRQMELFRNESVEVLPLYARLPSDQQQRIFTPGGRRRIVLATNVAESSVTVPGIRFVIDTGTARISRYSARSKTQRLPIEAISQASADQRKGRCGRIGPGICVRLYSEEDYNYRDRYTQPEIQRTNLASVILQTKTLHLGRIEAFPFIDPPLHSAIVDGYKTLFELQAITAPNANGNVTELGHKLSALPVDPRIGRMVFAALDESASINVLREVLVIAAALEIRDPRERPVEKQGEADAAHRKFQDARSDFLGLLKLWDFYTHLKRTLSRNQLHKACRQNFLSWNRLREWEDVYFQLLELVGDQLKREKKPMALLRGNATKGSKADTEPAPFLPDDQPISAERYAAIHRSLLSGLLANIGAKSPTSSEYLVGGGGKCFLWPGSGLVRKPDTAQAGVQAQVDSKPSKKEEPTESAKKALPPWVVASEMVETSKRFLRTLAAVNVEWIEALAPHLVHRAYSEPHWFKQNNTVMIYEKVTLFGLTLVPRRRVPYSKVDPKAARSLFIQQGLVEANWVSKAAFYVHNVALMERLEQVQAKLRQYDFLPSTSKLYTFYDECIPLEVCDNATMVKWLREMQNEQANGPYGLSGREALKAMELTERDLLDADLDATLDERFPDTLPRRFTSKPTGVKTPLFPLEYRFQPGEEDDGVILHTTLETVHQVDPRQLEWGIPGTLEERVTAIIKSLPKETRRKLVPAPDTARAICKNLKFGEGDLLEVLAAALTRIAGERITAASLDLSKVPDSLRICVQVSDAAGKTLASSRDYDEVLRQVGSQAEEKFAAVEDPRWTKTGLTSWNFGDLPEHVQVASTYFHKSQKTPHVEHITAYPMLVDEGRSVAMRLASSAFQAEQSTRQAILRLFRLHARKELTQQAAWIPGFAEMKAQATAFSKETQTPFVETVCDLLARAAFEPEGFARLSDMPPLLQQIPRSQREFEVLCKTARGRISVVVQEVATPLRTFWKAFHEAIRALDEICQKAPQPTKDQSSKPATLRLGELKLPSLAPEAPTSPSVRTAASPLFQPIVEDITRQLRRLCPSDFMLTTPWTRLRHFSRYFQAIAVRVEALRNANAGGKQARLQTETQIPELEHFWNRWEELDENCRLRCVSDSRLEEFRWMLEEYRVSLFAQKLGTTASVSAKRLEKMLEGLG